MGVPLVAVGHGRAAVGIDDRGDRGLGRGAGRAHEEAGDLQPVVGAEGQVLEFGVGGAPHRQRRRGVQRARGRPRRKDAQLGGRRVVLVGRDHRAQGGPAWVAPQPALGEHLGLAARRVDRDEVEAVAAASHREDAPAVGVPLGLGVVGAGGRELPVAASVGADQVQLEEAASLGRVDDGLAVRRPGRTVVVHARRSCQGSHGAVGDRDHADLAAVEVAARRERVGDRRAGGRDGRLALVAVLVEALMARCEALRPGVLEADHRQPRRVVALDLDDQAVVPEPDRSRALHEPSGRPTSGGNEPDVPGVHVGHGRPVGRKPRRGIFPIRRGIAARGQPIRHAALGVDEPHVRGVGVLDEDPEPPAPADGQRARPRRRGDRLQPPMRGRPDVPARLGEDALVLVLADPHRQVVRAHPRGPPRGP